MTNRYHSLACLLIFVLGAVMLFSSFSKINLYQTDIIKALTSADTESRFAAGLKVNLSEIDRYDLELIPGIPQESSDEIMLRRLEIILKAISLPTTRQHEAFQLIKGIGPEKAKLLANFLAFH